MPRANIPAYRRHKPSGQAVVTLSGRDHYLGPWGTKVSRDAYDRTVGEWLARGRAVEQSRDSAGVTVNQVIAAWWVSGKLAASHLAAWKRVARTLRRLYGTTPADEFGPVALKAVRLQLVAEKLTRSTINADVQKIRRMFRFAVGCELVSATVADALDAVEGLRRGEADVPESRKVHGVPDATVEQVVSAAPPTLAAMIRLQRLTGMRAGELVIMRTGDIDRSGPVWSYTPTQHKGIHREQSRTVFIGPRGRDVLQPFLRLDKPDAFIFSPAESERARIAARTAARRTPRNQGNGPGDNRRSRPKIAPGDRYRVDTYRRAIAYVCAKAFPVELPPALARPDGESRSTWLARLTPEEIARVRELSREWQKRHWFTTHQLRHAKGKELRDAYGLDTVQAVLGHKHAKTSEIYSEIEQDRAREAAIRLG